MSIRNRERICHNALLLFSCCAVDGGWGQFGDWGTCFVSCGGGNMEEPDPAIALHLNVVVLIVLPVAQATLNLKQVILLHARVCTEWHLYIISIQLFHLV